MNKSIFKIFFILIGAIVGAGFASGKEIFTFFSQYGLIGILGAIFSSFLTSYIIYKTIKLIKHYKINNYSDFITITLNNKNKFITNIFKIIVNSFLYVSFIIMISGFASFFYEVFNFNKLTITILISLFCLFLFNNKIDYIININSYLIPILIVTIVFYSTQEMCNFGLLNIENNNLICSFINSILYSSYNSILLIPVVISMNNLIKKIDFKDIKIISLLIFITLSVLSICLINLLFLLDNNLLTSLDIPILFAIKRFGNVHYIIYGVIIIIAILTSAISSGYSFMSNFNKSTNYIYISIILCFSSILLYNINFSTLVTNLYPLFGILGIIQILYILLKKIPKTDIN